MSSASRSRLAVAGGGLAAMLALVLGGWLAGSASTGLGLGEGTYCVGRCGGPLRTCEDLGRFVHAAIAVGTPPPGEPHVVQLRARASEIRMQACPRGEWDVGWDHDFDDVLASLERGDYPVTLTLRYMGVDADAPIGRYHVLGARLRLADDWWLAMRRQVLE